MCSVRHCSRPWASLSSSLAATVLRSRERLCGVATGARSLERGAKLGRISVGSDRAQHDPRRLRGRNCGRHRSARGRRIRGGCWAACAAARDQRGRNAACRARIPLRTVGAFAGRLRARTRGPAGVRRAGRSGAAPRRPADRRRPPVTPTRRRARSAARGDPQQAVARIILPCSRALYGAETAPRTGSASAESRQDAI